MGVPLASLTAILGKDSPHKRNSLPSPLLTYLRKLLEARGTAETSLEVCVRSSSTSKVIEENTVSILGNIALLCDKGSSSDCPLGVGSAGGRGRLSGFLRNSLSKTEWKVMPSKV